MQHACGPLPPLYDASQAENIMKLYNVLTGVKDQTGNRTASLQEYFLPVTVKLPSGHKSVDKLLYSRPEANAAA